MVPIFDESEGLLYRVELWTAEGHIGTLLAKGSFNNLAQLESVLATAEQRRAAATEAPAGA